MRGAKGALRNSVVVSHVRRDEAAPNVGHPAVRISVVVSHVRRDETAPNVGHPASVDGKE